MKESLRYLYQAELIATRTAQCVVEFHLLAAAGKTYHLTTHILTCFCIDSHTTPQDNLSNTLQHSGQSSAQLSMFSLASVATHCIAAAGPFGWPHPLFPTLSIQCRKTLAKLCKYMYYSNKCETDSALYSVHCTCVYMESPSWQLCHLFRPCNKKDRNT